MAKRTLNPIVREIKAKLGMSTVQWARANGFNITTVRAAIYNQRGADNIGITRLIWAAIIEQGLLPSG